MSNFSARDSERVEERAVEAIFACWLGLPKQFQLHFDQAVSLRWETSFSCSPGVGFLCSSDLRPVT